MIAPNKSTMTIREFYLDVYQRLKMLNATGATIQQTDVAINRFERFLGHTPTLADLTEDNVTAWMAAGLKAGLAPATINNRFRQIKSLWRLAVRKRYIVVTDENNLETVDRLRNSRRLPRAWSIEEMELIVRSARQARGRFMGIAAGLSWEALILLLFDTGLRVAAAMGCRFDELDWSTGVLTIPPERMKNECEQHFKLHPQTLEALLATIPPKRSRLFPWPFNHQRSLYGRFRRILKRAGLPHSRFDLFHKIRRTTATHVARALGEVAAIQQLGHRDQSCIGRYVDRRFLADHNAAASLPRPAWESPKVLTIEVATPATEARESVSVRYTAAELRGEGLDIFGRLAQQTAENCLHGPDVLEAMIVLGLGVREFADECGINARYMGRLLKGKEPIGHKARNAIGRRLGIAKQREGECDRADEPQRRSWQPKLKGGAA